MTASDAILWTRATDPTGTAAVALTAQVSTDPNFSAGFVTSYPGTTVTSADFTLKVDATGLAPNTTYFYRFVDSSGAASAVGTFETTPAAAQKAEVVFGFSGDADGRFRPYTSIAGFGTAVQPQTQNLRFFTFLGDTIYETASTGSVVVPTVTSATTGPALATALAAYDRKYLENIQGVVTATGAPTTVAGQQQGLEPMFVGSGEFTELDNHELGNVSLQSGGAPLAAGARVTPSQGMDVNTTGAFDNQTAGFKTLEKAYFDYHATREGLDAALNSTGPTVVAPNDPRSNGTVQQYFAQQEGANAVYIALDDRSYRDARLGTDAGADDVTSGRQLNPNRTMLGATQLAWFKQTLLSAQAAGTPWKIVAISTPIDQTGPAQDGKSWYGGYTAERNDLLKFIADNKISNVVFLTTDDHLTRENSLLYQRTFGDASTTTTVPTAFQVVTGPIGAGGPDLITDHSYANITSLAAAANAGLTAAGAPTVGLSGFSGLSNVHRQGDTAAGTAPSSIDFYSPDTFNYTILDITPDGSRLNVDTYGIPSYTMNTFPQTSAAPTDIMGFSLAAGFTAAVPCYCPGTLILTNAGEVAVERLAIGDQVVTASGALRPIRWIGHRSYAGRFLRGQAHLLPVRIGAGALADGVPRRDLLVSPLHAMFLDGVLIPASALVNGASIVQLDDVGTVEYVHVELDTHDIILAEGAPAETFVDDESRGMFHNAPAYRALYPNAVAGPARYCAPRVEDGEALETVRRRINARTGSMAAPAPGRGYLESVTRARIAGWAAAGDEAVALQVFDNGKPIARVIANVHRGDLEAAGVGRGRHGFDLVLPGGLSPDRQHLIDVRLEADGSPLVGSPIMLEAAGRFDASLEHAVMQAVAALDANGDRERVLSFFAAQSYAVLQQRAETECGAAPREAARLRARRLGVAEAAPEKRALVIDERVPAAARDAGSQAVLSHIRALQTLGYAVSFVAADEMGANAEPLAALQVKVCGAPFYASVEEVLRRQAGCFDVVYLHRASIAGRYMSLVRQYAPRARVLYSVADLHHLRLARQAAVEGMPELLAIGRRLRQTECTAALAADAVLTHSLAEMAVLERAVPEARIVHAPWAVPLQNPVARKTAPGFRARRGLAFIGHYGHAPNIDAARWLIEAVMPIVWQAAPQIECLLAGTAMPKHLRALAGDRVRVLGEVGDLHAEIYDQVRLTVAPMRFGAGVKGKVLESLAAGVPCAMTTIGAEGMDLPASLQTLIGTDAAGLAEVICRLHGTGAAHRAAATAGLAYIRRTHNEAAVVDALRGAIMGMQVGRLALAG